MNKDSLIKELKKFGNKERAEHSKYFFKTGKGQYGEGDIFIGATVPECRVISKKYKDLDKKSILELLKNPYHEVRLVSLHILVLQYEDATKSKNDKEREVIFNFYFKNRKYINNWDLVDTSVYKIFGNYLFENKKASEIKEVLTSLSNSKNLWDRRISIVSTYTFIKKGVFSHTLDIVLIIKNDKEDLNHKACGWMLREVGKKDENVLKSFLQKYKNSLPRTTLRYAIERFSEAERKQFLAK